MLEPFLDQGHFFAAVHPFDLERRLGMHLTNSANGTRQFAISRDAAQPSPSQALQTAWFAVGLLRGRPFLDVLEPLLEEANDVLIVEGVEHHSSLPAGANESHAAEQP